MSDIRKNSVSVIGGADGPTSIFTAGKSGKKPLKQKVLGYIYKCRRKRAEKKITAGAHTLEELAAYAADKYGAAEVDNTKKSYEDSKSPMDFHIYEIKYKESSIEIEIDYIWKKLGVSYCCDKSAKKRVRNIARDLYIYYGVNERDIRDKTERYSALLAALSS